MQINFFQGEPGTDGSMGLQGDVGFHGTPGMNIPGGASTFINWGLSNCPSGYEIVYSGRAVAPAFDNAGGGAEYICLAQTANTDTLTTMSASPLSTVVGVHLETFADPSAFLNPMDIEPLSSNNGDAVECAVCVIRHSAAIMIPNSVMCPSNAWNMAYTGYLMTARDFISSSLIRLNHDPVFGNTATENHLRPHFRTEYVCLNQNFNGNITGSLSPTQMTNEAKMSHVRLYCTIFGLFDGCAPHGNCGGVEEQCSFGPLSCTVCTTSSLA